jgi:hypothetical protein
MNYRALSLERNAQRSFVVILDTGDELVRRGDATTGLALIDVR